MLQKTTTIIHAAMHNSVLSRSTPKPNVLWRMPGAQSPTLRAQTLKFWSHPRLQPSAARCMTTKGGSQDKSWSEIASDAVQLARTAVSKAAKSVSEAAGSLLPGKSGRESQGDEPLRRRPYSQSLGPTFSEGDGGLYHPARSWLGDMFEVMSMSGRDTAGIKDRALSMIQSDDQIRSVLGDGVSILPGLDSQSTSTSIINGRKTTQTSISFLVTGRNGYTAQAQAEVTARPDGQEDLKVNVQLPDGRVVRKSEDSSPGGAIIDVDWKETR